MNENSKDIFKPRLEGQFAWICYILQLWKPTKVL